jgi:hypothetical protein
MYHDDFPAEYNGGKIYKESDGTCTVSFRSQWICGIYAGEEVAKAAIDLCVAGKEGKLAMVWNGLRKNHPPITLTQLEV